MMRECFGCVPCIAGKRNADTATRRGDEVVKLVMDSMDGTIPKRGDIVQTNVGNGRERTCLILRTHRVRGLRFHVWAERWWELEPDQRMRLYRSAERAGGQSVLFFKRYAPKKKRAPFPLFDMGRRLVN